MTMMNGISPISIEKPLPPSGIFDLSRQLVATNALEVLLDSTVRQAVSILGVKFSLILTLEPDGRFSCQASHSSDPLDRAYWKERWALSRSQAVYHRVILNDQPVIVGRGSGHTGELRGSSRGFVRLGESELLYLVPLRVDEEALGLLVLGDEEGGAAQAMLQEKLRLAVLIAEQAASAIYRARLSYRLEESQLQTVLALAKVMESRDSYVAGHSRKVTEIAVRLARKLNCSPAEVQTIRWAGLLHDIGKVGIPDGILNKRDKLSAEEWKVIRDHPRAGAEIVRMASNLDYVAALIQSHHEAYDGSGYPYGLQREMIPFGARILSVADAFSAMTDDRPYRASCPVEYAMAELQRCAGKQFDPHVVEAFIALNS